jgi:hypothetical protein
MSARDDLYYEEREARYQDLRREGKSHAQASEAAKQIKHDHDPIDA